MSGPAASAGPGTLTTIAPGNATSHARSAGLPLACQRGSAAGCRSASRPDNPHSRRRVDHEQAGRPDRAPDELAAAVRADAVQDVLRAVAAPGALEGADKHVRGRRVEIPVTAFAVRPQLQHPTSIGRHPQLEQAGRTGIGEPSSHHDDHQLHGNRPISPIRRGSGADIDHVADQRRSASYVVVVRSRRGSRYPIGGRTAKR